MSLVYSLTTRKWSTVFEKGVTDSSVPWNKSPPDVSEGSLKGVSVKGRSSHEEKEAWLRGGRRLLSDRPWSISKQTDLEEIEQVVVVLAVSSGSHLWWSKLVASVLRACFIFSLHRLANLLTPRLLHGFLGVLMQKYLEHWTQMSASPYEWCVGASLRATYAGRDKVRASHMFPCELGLTDSCLRLDRC